MLSRRNFLTGSAIALVSAAAVSGRAEAAAIPEAPTTNSPAMQPPVPPPEGQAYQPVVTLNGWTLPWRMNGEWKEFHLVAEEVTREIAPGMTARLWGYNGQTPGPTIEAVEGDKVRIFVTNKLPEHTTVHWHGMLLPNGMDGVGGLTQPHIPVGQTFVYEFLLNRSGTFMYHPHSDEMVQMAMGMMGSVVVHPKDPGFRRVDRDFAFVMSAYRFDPGTSLPKVAEMTDFNIWTFNARVFPGIDVLPVRLGDRVRIRIANLTMTNHPIHLHGHHFAVGCTDGGWVPESAQWPETTVDVPGTWPRARRPSTPPRPPKRPAISASPPRRSMSCSRRGAKAERATRFPPSGRSGTASPAMPRTSRVSPTRSPHRSVTAQLRIGRRHFRRSPTPASPVIRTSAPRRRSMGSTNARS